MLVRMQNKKNSQALLVGMQNGATTMKNRLVVSYTVKHTLPYGPEIPLLGLYPSETKSLFTQKPEYNVYSGFFLL